MRPDVLVKPLHEREPDNATGPFYVVINTCLLCGFPPEVAAQNISWNTADQPAGCQACPRNCRVHRQPETSEELARMIEAACYSCIEAIRYCGTDPEILQRFRAEGMERLCDALCQPTEEPA
jgi:hypothetical protein